MLKARTISLTDGNWTKHFEYYPGKDSQFVMKEVIIDECYAFDFKPWDIVLNLGGHHGAFDVFAYDKVNEIITFEPSRENYERLVFNTELNNINNCILVNRAIARHYGYIGIHISEQGGHNSCVLNGENCISVPCSDIEDIFKFKRFTKIKCDIEGFEFELFDGLIIPESVNEMWFETHIFNKEMGTQHIKFQKQLIDQGFEQTVYKNDPNNTTFLEKYKRK